jgi:hypothetical protein
MDQWGIGTLTNTGDLAKFEPFEQLICPGNNAESTCTYYDPDSVFDTTPSQDIMGVDSIKWVWFGPQPHSQTTNKQVPTFTRFQNGRISTLALVNSSQVGISTSAVSAWQFARGDDLTYRTYCYVLDSYGNSNSGPVDGVSTKGQCRATSAFFSSTLHKTVIGKRHEVDDVDDEEEDDEDFEFGVSCNTSSSKRADDMESTLDTSSFVKRFVSKVLLRVGPPVLLPGGISPDPQSGGSVSVNFAPATTDQLPTFCAGK